jgi:CheY-like chemotaxis protein/phosphoribosyl 1,2-cyclic phosphodiesterase
VRTLALLAICVGAIGSGPIQSRAMKIRFWGTRGSIAKPGPATVRYGGNTSCVELRAADGTLIVLDCGTGAYGLGKQLTQSKQPVAGNLMIGHTHWDHIQGFPFFDPLFVERSKWTVYAPGGGDRRLQAALAGQMAYEYSPINLDSLMAELSYADLTEGVFEVGSVRVTTQYLNHPALTLGFRFEADGATAVYACDHEPHSLHPLDAPAGAEPIHHEDRRHVKFLAGADLIVHDAQYTLADFPEKAGWGHTPLERAVDYAIRARTKRLIFTHHDPDRDDAAVDALCAAARARAAGVPDAPAIDAACEGMVVEVAGGAHPRRGPLEREASALLPVSGRGPATVLVVDDDPDMALLLETTLRADGIRVISAHDGETALKLVREKRPSLVLLDMQLPRVDGMAVCRELRAESDPALRDIPILILTGLKLSEGDLVDAFVAGATDYLTKPIKPTLVRSRVRGWLLRTAAP